MIDLLETIKKRTQLECVIGGSIDRDVYYKPAVVLAPVSENWTHNLLGNPDRKRVRFTVEWLKSYRNEEYLQLVKEAVGYVKNILTDDEVKKHIVSFIRTNVRYDLIEEDTMIKVTTDITLDLRRENGN